MDNFDKFVLSTVALIILFAIMVGILFIGKSNGPKSNYMFKGKWFENKGKMV